MPHLMLCGGTGSGKKLLVKHMARKREKKVIFIVFGFNSPQAIYKWQNGTALPTVDNLIVLAALLNVRIDDILVTTVA